MEENPKATAAAVAEFLPTEPPAPLPPPQPPPQSQSGDQSTADQVVAPAIVPEKD